jgi:hypothetical protein
VTRIASLYLAPSAREANAHENHVITTIAAALNRLVRSLQWPFCAIATPSPRRKNVATRACAVL